MPDGISGHLRGDPPTVPPGLPERASDRAAVGVAYAMGGCGLLLIAGAVVFVLVLVIASLA